MFFMEIQYIGHILLIILKPATGTCGIENACSWEEGFQPLLVPLAPICLWGQCPGGWEGVGCFRPNTLKEKKYV